MTAVEPWGAEHVIAGKYRLLHQLGKGGMGSVWAANHLALNSRVAVKIIDPAIADSQEALERFLREAQAAAALRSPHVVQTFDYGVDGGVPFITMELLEGRTLAQRLEAEGTIPLENTAVILTQVSRAIAKAHEMGIVHRDLKPDNIFLVTNDDDEVAKVLDFGIAKAAGGALGQSSQTRTGAVLGTPYYMSPEQAEGNKSVDHRTDLWSLAVIAFECVTGKRPFESQGLGDLILQICARPIRKPSSVLPGLPEAFDEFFSKGTQRDLSLRFQSARELSTALRLAAGLRAMAGETSKLRAPEPAATAAPALAAVPTPAQNFAPTPAQNFVPTPAQSFANTPGPLNGTTGSAAAVAHTSIPVRSQTPLIVGATVATLALAAGVAFFVLKGGAPAATAAPPVSEKPLATAVTAAPAPKPEVTEPRVEVAPAPKAAPADDAPKEHIEDDGMGAGKLGLTPLPSSTSGEGAGKHPPPVVKKAPVAKAPPAAAKPPPTKPADKPASTPRPRMDFGF